MAGKRTGWLAALGVAAAGGAALTAAAKKLFRTTVEADASWQYGGKDKDSHPYSRYGERPKQDREWFLSEEMEDVRITSSIDDTGLHARYYPCEDPKRFILCAHGYRSTPEYHFAGVARWLHEIGCTLLFIDERGCGQSEGRYITFGAREKYDVMDWFDWLDARNPEQRPMYLYGVSMGATAVMCASEYVLPASFAGLIADCGFTSMKDILAACMKSWYNINLRSLLWTVDQFCREEAHFSMAEADAEKALRKCNRPALIIHGTEDHFVPPSHAVRNYHACAAPKKDILWVDGAGHAASWYQDTEKYQEAVLDLFGVCEQ